MVFEVKDKYDIEVASLIVALDKDYKQSEIEELMGCIKHFKQVLDVTAKRTTVADYTARQRERKRFETIVEHVLREEE